MQWTRGRLKPPLLEAMRNTSVVMRLGVGFGALLLLLVVVGTVGWLAAGSLSRSAQALVAVDHQQARRVATLEKAVAEMALATTAVSLTDDRQDIAYEAKRLKLGLQAYAATATELEAAEQAWADPRVGELMAAVRDARSATTGLMEQIASKAEAGVARETLADFVATQLRPPQDAWFKSLAALDKAVDDRMLAHAADAEHLALQVQTVLAATSALAVALGLAAAVLISRSVSRPLRSAVTLAQSVSQGDLSQALPAARKDEFGVLFGALGEMQASLRHVVGDIRVAADGIQSASTEVAGGNADLSQRTETTAAQLQQAAASMQQLSGSLQLGSGAAQTAKSLAAEAAKAARSGGAVVQEVVGNMASIADSSRRIADITGVIDGIAFQTNLLALNAAVEAARAGEQGRGFAVVAGEVRTLAHRAAAAAREIKALIGASSDKVAAGSQRVQGAGSTMAEIVVAVQRVAQAVTEISDATTRQSQDVAAVGQVVNEIDTMTQQNAALVEQSSAAASMLAEQAARMNALIGTFRLAADCGAVATASPASGFSLSLRCS